MEGELQQSHEAASAATRRLQDTQAELVRAVVVARAVLCGWVRARLRGRGAAYKRAHHASCAHTGCCQCCQG